MKRMMAVGVMVMAGLVLSARTIDEALSESKLPRLAEFSSYVTVFNELEEMDAEADQAWLDLPDRAAYDRHRRALHAKMIEAMGGLPEKAPLNARTVSVIRKQGYRVEKVIFESMPGLCVTANLFVPDGVTAERPAPAVVMSCGHGEDGKDDPVYLRACWRSRPVSWRLCSIPTSRANAAGSRDSTAASTTIRSARGHRCSAGRWRFCASGTA